MTNVVFHPLNKACQKDAVKTLSLSETIVLGIPCKRTTCYRKALATEPAVYGCLSGMKCEYLVNLLTTTKMTEYPSDIGSPSMKSSETSCQAPDGMGNGCNRPGSLQCSCFAL